MATVLIVEDTADLRDAFLEIVTDAGYNAVGAENGQCALDVLESLEEPPALVLLDIMMPVMDGWQFLQRLRSMNRVPALPVVIVSAVPTPRAGVPDVRKFVPKPIGPEALLDVVREFCGPPS